MRRAVALLALCSCGGAPFTVETLSEPVSAMDASATAAEATPEAARDAGTPDAYASLDVATEAPAKTCGPAWAGLCAECVVVHDVCPKADAIGLVCPGDCNMAPPIAAGFCTDSVATPWDGQNDSSATLLWCCPSNPGASAPDGSCAQ